MISYLFNKIINICIIISTFWRISHFLWTYIIYIILILLIILMIVALLWIIMDRFVLRFRLLLLLWLRVWLWFLIFINWPYFHLRLIQLDRYRSGHSLLIGSNLKEKFDNTLTMHNNIIFLLIIQKHIQFLQTIAYDWTSTNIFNLVHTMKIFRRVGKHTE